MELSNLIQGAQDAMERGDYRLAIAATNHALQQYPNCLAANRMLGEAHLERADQQSAINFFEKALAVDPLNVVSRLGLGVASEEKRDFQAAYAHYLHAWELNPSLDQVRDELVRIRGLLNVEDRLHPTRAGLAGVHARSGQFARAIAEWRAVLAMEPDSRRARTSIAELLWRQGDDHAASVAARDALRGTPENARALALLAELERRRGATSADEFAQRYRAVDPTADVAAILAPWRTDADLSFLSTESAPVEAFDFAANASRDTGPLGGKRASTASLAAGHIAAPDLWDTLVRDLSSEIPATSVAPTLASAADREQHTAPLSHPVAEQMETSSEPVDEVIQATAAESETFSEPAEEVASVAASAEDIDAEPFDMSFMSSSDEATDAQPVGFGDALELSADEEAGLAELMAVMGTMEPQRDHAPAMTAQADRAISETPAHSTSGDGASGANVSFAMDPVMGTVEPVRGALDASAMDSWFTDIGSEPARQDSPPPPATVSPTPPPPPAKPAPFSDPFVAADGTIDLTSGWDDLDRQLAAATPSAEAATAFDDLLAELNVDGIQPFDAETKSPDDDAWQPFSMDDFGGQSVVEPVAASQEPPAKPFFVAEVPAQDDSAVVAEAVAPEPAPSVAPEIVAGIPVPATTGYTEILRNIDEDRPVDVLDDDNGGLFDGPDATGAPLEIDALLEVTSSDGTGPLPTMAVDNAADDPFDFSNTDLEAAMPAEYSDPVGLDLDGIVPFDSASFGEGSSSGEASGFDYADLGLRADPVASAAPAESEVMPFPDVEPFQAEQDIPAVSETVADVYEAPAEAEPPQDAVAGDAVAPFVFDDAPRVFDDASPVNFDELNTPFDPMPFVAEAVPTEEEEADDAVLDVDEQTTYTSVLRSSGLDVEESTTADEEVEEAVEPTWTGREGLGPVAHKILWPQFVNQTSGLIDRALETENLFARIAQQKDALIEMGMVAVTRSLVPVPAPAIAAVDSTVEETGIRVVPSAPQPVMSDQARMDLMAMRARLSEDDESAGEIAGALEKAISEGMRAPLAQRVLGEAYLKLGQVERAAAQFRQAMLGRRRSG